MPRYTDDSKERVRDAVDMIALVSARTELRRAGVNSYFGRCPFHEERTGSFHVRPEEKHYHCFGCQASGDPFRFVMETEGLDFVAAMESLAERFGVTLEVADEDPLARARRERRERLWKLLDRAAAYYARVLWESAEAAPARDYLAGRGLEEATLKAYRVGYAPSAWDRLLLVARQAGFSEDELLATGLAQRSKQQRGSIYDRFRERIMFPLADARGRVLGFGARAMRDNQQPKYLNTSEGEVFHKGSQLFGIDLARKAAARAGAVVLAEGYTDVLALHQSGVENAVGIMGTSFTDEQARELARTARTLVLALDADGAGQEAMLRAARVAEGRSLELRVVALPPGADPADLAQSEGAEALRARIGRSTLFISFYVDRVLSRTEVRSAEDADRLMGEIAPVLWEFLSDRTQHALLREELKRRVASRLQLTDSVVAALLDETRHRSNRDGRPHPGSTPAAPSDLTAASQASIPRQATNERAFLALCVAYPREGQEMLSRLDPERHLTSNVMRRVARHLSGHLARPLEAMPTDDSEVATAISDIDARAAVGRASSSPRNLEHAWLTLEFVRLEREIKMARLAGIADGTVGTLGREREQVRTKLRELSGQLQAD